MISHSPSSRVLSSRTPTDRARKALFIGVPVAQSPDSAGEASQAAMAKADALRHIPVARPVENFTGPKPPQAQVAGEAADPEFSRRVVRGEESQRDTFGALGHKLCASFHGIFNTVVDLNQVCFCRAS